MSLAATLIMKDTLTYVRIHLVQANCKKNRAVEYSNDMVTSQDKMVYGRNIYIHS